MCRGYVKGGLFKGERKMESVERKAAKEKLKRKV